MTMTLHHTASPYVGKVAALVTREGDTLTDSSLIMEYLACLAPEAGLLPLEGPERWRVRWQQALAHGMLDAIITRAIENQIRPERYRWDDWARRHEAKTARALDCFEAMCAEDDIPQRRVDLATISLASTLGYLVDRLGEEDWRRTRPALSAWYDGFAARDSMRATVPPRVPPPHLDPRRG